MKDESRPGEEAEFPLQTMLRSDIVNQQAKKVIIVQLTVSWEVGCEFRLFLS